MVGPLEGSGAHGTGALRGIEGGPGEVGLRSDVGEGLVLLGLGSNTLRGTDGGQQGDQRRAGVSKSPCTRGPDGHREGPVTSPGALHVQSWEGG